MQELRTSKIDGLPIELQLGVRRPASATRKLWCSPSDSIREVRPPCQGHRERGGTNEKDGRMDVEATISLAMLRDACLLSADHHLVRHGRVHWFFLVGRFNRVRHGASARRLAQTGRRKLISGLSGHLEKSLRQMNSHSGQSEGVWRPSATRKAWMAFACSWVQTQVCGTVHTAIWCSADLGHVYCSNQP